MIEELKQIEGAGYFGVEYQYVDLLEYVSKVANEFVPDVIPDVSIIRYPLFHGIDKDFTMYDNAVPILDYSRAPNIFALRYFRDEIDTNRKEIYMEAVELQDTLQAFGIDASKYWYLVLFVKDYVDDRCNNAPLLKFSAKEELQQLVERLSEIWREDWKCPKKATLTLKVEGKHNLVINNHLSFAGLCVAIENYLPAIEDGSRMSECRFGKDSVNLAPIYKIYLFTDIMKWFLKPFKANWQYKASLDKLLLISRTIYTVGLSTNKERYYEEYKEKGKGVIKQNSLKNDLRHYEGIKIKTASTIYM